MQPLPTKDPLSEMKDTGQVERDAHFLFWTSGGLMAHCGDECRLCYKAHDRGGCESIVSDAFRGPQYDFLQGVSSVSFALRAMRNSLYAESPSVEKSAL